ncbi:MAG: LLM class F420-dependent oxidoreductase [Chloroflexi bacterium]|nr:LLM class F420-dependent oxidoreductase [Chloroflexota bacterium]|tara:strand:- start:23300 stop:24313 length:1014 start_codon:yes stop_codon:yes gene_type:complete
MKVYCDIASYDLKNVPELAKRAEELGFDGISFGELAHDSFLLSTLALEHTKRLKVATGIAIAFARSPMVCAYMAWDLQRMSDGRFELGLGSQVKGHNERRFSVNWSAPAPRLKEYVESIKAIWDCWQNGTHLDYRGEHYGFTLMTPEFDPGPLECAPPPVYIAAVGPGMTRVAAASSDGVLLHTFNNKRYVDEIILPQVSQGANRSGIKSEEVFVSGGGMIAVGASEEEVQSAREVYRKRISFYGSTRSYKTVMDMYEWGDTCLRLHEMSKEGKWDEMPNLIDDTMLDTFCVSGTYKNIGPSLKARYGDYASRISIKLPSDEKAYSDVGDLINYLHE